MSDVRLRPPAPPAFGEPLEGARADDAALAWLSRRRSTPAVALQEPGPGPDEVDALLTIAARAPDHGKLAPWRFVVFEGAARSEAGAALEAGLRRKEPDLPEERYAVERERFTRAPVVVAVVSRADPAHPKIPEWEQVLSSGAVCFNLLLAAQTMGYAGQWLTEWCAYDRGVLDAFGLSADERIAGYIYLGSANGPSTERARPDVAALITRWGR